MEGEGCCADALMCRQESTSMAVLSFLRGLKRGSVLRVRFIREMTSSSVNSASIANNKRNQQCG